MKYTEQFTVNNFCYSIQSLDDYSYNITDLAALKEVFDDTEVYKYVSSYAIEKYSITGTDDLARSFLETSSQRWKDKEELRFIVRSSATNEIAGVIGVNLDNEGNELWYYKSSKYKAFMSTALPLALKFVKEEGISDLVANLDKDNYKSKRLLLELGFKLSSKDETDEYYELFFF